MSREAFDMLLSRLDSEDREHIHEMAMAYGLTFDDPSWVPFAITQMTLNELKVQVGIASKAIEEAADLALRKIGNSARVVSNQAQTVIEAQSRAVQDLRATILDIERTSAVEYRKLLAELAAAQIGKLVEKGTNGIVQDVTRRLTGRDGMLARGAFEHAAALEQAQKQFASSVDAVMAKIDAAARNAAASTHRGVRNTVYLAMGTIVIYAATMFGLMYYWGTYEGTANTTAPQTCSTMQRPNARSP